MIVHCIIMSSSYSLGTRIALDYVMKEESFEEKLKQASNKIMQECGRDVAISIHTVQAENETWESVCNADHFFYGVKVMTDIDFFIKLIQKDRILKGVDVAKYILSKFPCTQLKLQKLVYLCFADYLCNTGKELFEDSILAYKYGPVVDTVYKRYKEYGYNSIKNETKDIDNEDVFEMPAKSRILFAKDGLEKIQSIDSTLKMYGMLKASELVDLTHRENTPWTKTEKKSWPLYQKIDNDTIKRYHKNEIIDDIYKV